MTERGVCGQLWWLLAGAAQYGRVIMGGWLMSVREKILGAEARWVMGRVMAGRLLRPPRHAARHDRHVLVGHEL